MRLDLYWDEAGDPRARAEEGRERLARYLESDLQSSAAAAREVLAAVEDVVAGALDEWEQTGNAYTLTLSPAGAILEDEWDEGEAEEIPLAELRNALWTWIEFLERGRAGA